MNLRGIDRDPVDRVFPAQRVKRAGEHLQALEGQ